MKQLNIILLLMFSTTAVFSQTKNSPSNDSSKNIQLEEVVISASNFKEKKRNIAQTIDVISAKKIALSQTQNTGDLLIQSGKVFVQKSQQGGSSPVIRGFEASRILLVVDGVRMNNAIYRSGHLQNIITVDQNSLSSVEVMNGAASTIYGSDALGGTIQLLTKNPTLSTTKNVLFKGMAFTRFSSANNEKTFHADINVGGKKIAFLQSFNYSDFDDMKMGDRYLSAFPNFGRRSLYISQINGLDTILKNSDDRKQVASGYQQWDWLEKILFKQNDHLTHI
ncbi:TonB-dependent receptor plug domain-containing protein [Ferruginibacter yonginensis]|uniref:TonB-dependent receptor plug domain-containing protein n=1 Tax=Ferruginibacter yonginensis TaxID=1310416 RepID=A0ABV8QQC9_9BACT